MKQRKHALENDNEIYKKRKTNTDSKLPQARHQFTIEDKIIDFIRDENSYTLQEILKELNAQHSKLSDIRLNSKELNAPCSVLFFAALLGRGHKVAKLMKADPSLETLAYQGRARVQYPIQLAALKGYSKTVIEIINTSQNVFLPVNDSEQNILHLLVILKDADLTPILHALNNKGKLKELINAKDNMGCTPLQAAMMRPKINVIVIENLLAFGADRNIPYKRQYPIDCVYTHPSSYIKSALLKIFRETKQLYPLHDREMLRQTSPISEHTHLSPIQELSQDNKNEVPPTQNLNLLQPGMTALEYTNLFLRQTQLELQLIEKEQEIERLKSIITDLKAKPEGQLQPQVQYPLPIQQINDFYNLSQVRQQMFFQPLNQYNGMMTPISETRDSNKPKETTGSQNSRDPRRK